MALESIKNQFTGLPMASLIGSPLKAACDAQTMLARSTVDFIKDVGFDGDKTRTADFSFDKNIVTGKDASGKDIIEQNRVSMEVPVLAIVNVPSLLVDEVDITFDMEVRSSEESKETEDKKGQFSVNAKVGWGPLSATAKVSGSVASHKENTRKSDNSAKYHVEVHASQAGTPEGLSRVLDIIGEAVAPKAIDNKTSDSSEMLEQLDKVNEAGRDVDVERAKYQVCQTKLQAAERKYQEAISTNEAPNTGDKKSADAEKTAVDDAKKSAKEQQDKLEKKQAELEKQQMILQLIRQGVKKEVAEKALPTEDGSGG
ncbi:alpha-amylase [Veronia nyctiphanis]|uniref:Alpha-amylase n=1 Tax=Veronia nyctiphanis TaxID=1278244 RepID=A0A4Q0YKF9_9GAMM|nr:DUF2589 domain-containing protein [Veronia nyctiphanis]RXJ71217.1 alpha-amylase [Veronia nyctiphanis]